MNEEKRKRILKALKDGRTNVEIAKKYHTSFTTISTLRKEKKVNHVMTPTKKENNPELLSVLITALLILIWISSVYDKPATLGNFIMSVIYFIIVAIAFIKMSASRI